FLCGNHVSSAVKGLRLDLHARLDGTRIADDDPITLVKAVADDNPGHGFLAKRNVRDLRHIILVKRKNPRSHQAMGHGHFLYGQDVVAFQPPELNPHELTWQLEMARIDKDGLSGNSRGFQIDGSAQEVDVAF